MPSGSGDGKDLDVLLPLASDAARKHGAGSRASQPRGAVSFAQSDMAVENAEQDDQVRVPRPDPAPHQSSFVGSKLKRHPTGVLVQKSLDTTETKDKDMRGLYDPDQIAAFFDMIKAGDYNRIR